MTYVLGDILLPEVLGKGEIQCLIRDTRLFLERKKERTARVSITMVPRQHAWFCGDRRSSNYSSPEMESRKHVDAAWLRGQQSKQHPKGSEIGLSI